LGKGAITAPLYISVAWGLIVSYQLFTQTAVFSLVGFLDTIWVSGGQLIISRIDTIVFIHAFAWIFVLSSVIPSIILGKGRSVLLQFFLCLTLTLVATSVEDIVILIFGANPTFQIEALSNLFRNPMLATLYLSIPYVFMLYLDIRARRGDRAGEAEKSEDAVSDEESTDEEVASEEEVPMVEEDVLLEEEMVHNEVYEGEPQWQEEFESNQ